MAADRGLTAALVVVTVVAAGCDAAPRSAWAGTVDTLAGGAVRVVNPARGTWDEATRWSLVEDLRLGSLAGDSPELFGQVADLDVDDAGRIYVLDSEAAEVRVFGPDGAYLRTLGRRGAGPGELRRPWAVQVDGEQRIWVVDLGNQRYAVFDTMGSLVEDKRRFTGGQVVPWPGAVLDDGRVVDVDLGPDGSVLTVHGPDGELRDTVMMPTWEDPVFTHTTEHARTSVSVPFSPRLRRELDRRGYLWTGVSGDYRIVQRDLTGRDSLTIVRRPWDPVPVTGDEVAAALEGMRWFREQGGRVDRSRIPDVHPAFEDFIVDRLGYLWVEPATPRSGDVTVESLREPRPSVFDVFDDAGRYLGRLEAGLALRSPLVTDTHLYGVVADDLGVQYVVRMRIQGRTGAG